MEPKKITTIEELRAVPQMGVLVTKDKRAIQFSQSVLAEGTDKYLRDALTQHGPFLLVWVPEDSNE